MAKTTGFQFASVATFATLALIVSSSSAMADLKSQFSLETTDVLPKNVGNPRFINLMMPMDSRFDATGARVDLGSKLNQSVTWSKVVDGESDPYKKSLIQASMAANGFKAGDSAGQATGVVTSYAEVRVPVLAFGLTDRFTLAVAAPIVQAEIKADTGFVASAQGQKFVDEAQKSSPADANRAADQLNDAINTSLQKKGYQPIRSQSISRMGDVQIIGKYLLAKDELSAMTLKPVLTLPTGKGHDPDMLVEAPTGDGRFQTGLMLIRDDYLPWDLRLNSFAGYNALLPNRMVRRIPNEAYDPVTADKGEVTRKWGHQFNVGGALDHQFAATGVVIGAGGNFQYLSAAHYSGDDARFADRYQYLDQFQPYQMIGSGIATAGFSSVDWYRKKRFVYPFEAKISYSHPFVGRNLNAGDIFGGELVLFF